MTKKRVAELEISVESIIETVREPLLVLDSDLRVIKANCSFYNFFKITPGETIGNFIYDLGNRQWDIPKLRTLLEDILPKDNNFDDYEVEHEFSNIGHKIMLFNARQITISSRIILLAIEDITERKQAGKVVHQTHDELQQLAVELTKGLRQAQADIIKNKRMENKLRESEERYRRIAEELTDYLYTVYVQDGQAVEVQHNEACEMLTGYTANEFAADPDLWIRIVVAQERDQAIEQVQKVLAGETVPPIEHHIVRKDGLT